jgi:hypothetical protein
MVKLFGFISSDIGSDYTQPEMGWLSEEDSYPVDQSAWMNKKGEKRRKSIVAVTNSVFVPQLTLSDTCKVS